MKVRIGTLGALVGALFPVLALPASAQVHYDATATITIPGGGNTVNSVSGMSNVQFFALSGSSLSCRPGDINALPVAKMTPYSGVGQNDQETYNGTYTVSIKITNDDVGGDGTVSFQGALAGYTYQGASSLVNTFTEPHTQSVTVGGTTFTVTLGTFAPPGAPITSADGLIVAYITCSPTATAVAGVTAPGSVKAGEAVQGTVTLNNPAPRGGATVALSTNTAAALSLPATVSIPEGATSAPFIGAAKAAGTNVSVRADWNGSNASATLGVTAGGLCGDTDGNGIIDMRDVVRWLRGVAGLAPLPTC